MRADLLYVVGVYSNPRRYAVRPRLLRQWVSDALDSGVNLTVVEHAFGERPYEFSKEQLGFKHVNLVQVRGGAQYELWLQYALYNKGFASLPDGARYLCWQDTDVKHLRADWAAETVQMLQHNRIGQTWTHSIDLDPKGNIATNEWGNDVDRSFCAAWLDGEIDAIPGYYSPCTSRALLPKKDKDWRSHTGYSWAARREVFDGIGKLVDWMVTGSADYHMALAFCGKLHQMIDAELKNGGAKSYSDAYYRRLREFADRCDDVIRQDLGVVPGTITAGWHGSKKKRFYGAREAVLTEAKFDPDRDIAHDVHGIPMLVGDNRALRDGLRRYNQLRDEDSIDL